MIELYHNAATSSFTTRSTAAVVSLSTAPTASSIAVPSVHFSARSSIGVIAGSVSASLFVFGIIVVTLIVLFLVYRGRLKKRKF